MPYKTIIRLYGVARNPANGFPARLLVPADHIGAAIRMFYFGMSHKQISEAMEKIYDIPELSKRAIYLWVKKYTDEAVDQMNGHKAHVGDEWVAESWPLTRAAGRCGYSM